MKIDRRRFLGFTAGAAAGAASGVPTTRLLSELVAAAEPPVYPPRGHEDVVLSVCSACPGGCGLGVRRVGGRVVKLEGNPLHPVNGGRLCPKGQAALQSLYHPDRLAQPMRRMGPRGSMASFEPIEWGEALDEIAARLKMLRAEDRPESLVLLRGNSTGLGARVAKRFLHLFGSPNDVRFQPGHDAAAVAVFLGQGVRAAPAYDLQSAEYVLSFGAALLEASDSPVNMMRAYGEFRQGRPGRRGKLVQVEPRLSLTGASADEWIRINPATESVFALGVAGVLVAEELYDAGFVNRRTRGFEELRTILERDYTLQSVSQRTGVPVNVILRIAREFAAARPGAALGPQRGPLLPGRVLDHLAAQWLNALSGSIDAPGGVLIPDQVSLDAWPDLAPDAVAQAGRKRPRLDGIGDGKHPHLRSDPEGLAEAILRSSPYAAEILMILDADPVLTSTTPERFREAIDRVPMVVSFASIPDDTALLADLILPQAHFLERWDLHTQPPGVPFPVVSLSMAAVEEPLHDVRPVAGIFFELARRTGAPVADGFPWRDPRDLIRSEVDTLYRKKRGAIIGTEFDEAWVRMMERAGWWAPGYRTADELWKRMQEAGGWWDPFYDHRDWKRVLRTDSGLYEIRSDLIEAAKQEETKAPADDSLALVLFEPLPIAGGTGAEIPFLQELLDPGHEERWRTWVEIEPETARHLGIEDRGPVRINSPHGSIVARAHVTTRVAPGVAAVPVGLGKQGGGRWARGIGANPLRLVAPQRDPLSGHPDTGSTRVRIEMLGRTA